MPLIETRLDRSVATITLNRPEKLNAFAATMREDLLAALHEMAGTAGCRVVVITGAGRAFCAGGDVEVMIRLQQSGDRAAFRRLLEAGGEVVAFINEMPQPVIASVNGVAAGAGCNLALACDYRIASAEAKLGQTFVRIGLHPDWGGTWLLPRLVGPSRALELAITGRMVDAAEALTIGLVDRVVPAAELRAATESFASAIAGGPPSVIRDIKQALRRAAMNDLRTQIRLESENQSRAFQAKDAAEGMAAFHEKRAPDFRGD